MTLMKRLLAGIVLITFTLVSALVLVRSQAKASSGTAETARTPVVVELFTSEGCSSCPPADALLARLDGAQLNGNVQLIALEEHVDYWNDLGWTDPSLRGTGRRGKMLTPAFSATATLIHPKWLSTGQRNSLAAIRRKRGRRLWKPRASPKCR